MKKAWIVVILIVVVGGAGAALFAVRTLKGRGESASVETDTVRRLSITATVSAPGRVEPASQVNLSAEVPGRIVELAVAEGDRVREGQLLLRLDDARYRSAVEQARAALASARANLELARARHDKARRDLDRVEGLRQGDLASEENLDRAQTDLRVAAAEVDARTEEVRRSEAALEVARDDLSKTRYSAPIDGVVSRLNVEAGENVVVGTMNNPGTVILTIADLGAMEVEAEVSETDVVGVDVGQAVSIEVDAVPDETFPGRVVSVGNSGRTSGRGTIDEAINFEVRVRFDEPDPRLRPGMTADVDIRTETRADVLTVPIQALVARTRAALARDREAADLDVGPWAEPDSLEGDPLARWRREIVEGVYRSDDGSAAFVPVDAGIADATRIEVSGDLEEGDEVVTGPYQVLRELGEGTRLEARGGGDD